MHHAVNNHLLHPSQYGGTPGRDSITPVLVTEMQYKITRATRKPFVTLNFDATSCYDQIIESVASLAARSFGQKNHSVLFMWDIYRKPDIYSKPNSESATSIFNTANFFLFSVQAKEAPTVRWYGVSSVADCLKPMTQTEMDLYSALQTESTRSTSIW